MDHTPRPYKPKGAAPTSQSAGKGLPPAPKGKLPACPPFSPFLRGHRPSASRLYHFGPATPFILGGLSSIQPMERRRTERLNLAIPLSVSVLNSTAPGHGTESVNLSAGGMYFETNLPVSRGTGVQILFKMPEEITRTTASDWVCMGHVVHVRPISSPNGWLGVGVQFDCYEVVPTAKSLAVSIHS